MLSIRLGSLHVYRDVCSCACPYCKNGKAVRCQEVEVTLDISRIGGAWIIYDFVDKTFDTTEPQSEQRMPSISKDKWPGRPRKAPKAPQRRLFLAGPAGRNCMATALLGWIDGLECEMGLKKP